MKTVILLFFSNIFMTFAWYGQLKYANPDTALWKIILISWGIAFFEYCLQVPANRIGYGRFSATQLKIIQEVISLTVFILFAIFILRENIQWNYIVSFGLILAAVYFAVGFSTT